MSLSDEPDVVIVGAGAAGTGAARRLSGSGLSIVSLEALPRAGGRAWTQTTGDATVDLGCGWLHSGDRNPWTGIAGALGLVVDRRPSAWQVQFRDLGFSPAERARANDAFERWNDRVADDPPASDIAADALDPTSEWTAYLQALSGFISGDELEQISCRDYAAYDQASTSNNWRVPAGYGTLVSAAMPADVPVHLSTPIHAIETDEDRVALQTPAGTLRARAVIMTVSTNVIAGDAIRWPSALDPWREAARLLPLGSNEKLYLEITGASPFEDESHLIGNPRDASTGSYYIRPFGQPVIECFLGGAGARVVSERGADAGFAHAIDQLAALFGNDIRRSLRPLIASDWTRTPSIGGAYSHALPGQADARSVLALPYDNRLFFAGEATHRSDFSTAHGAFESGVRAADEAIAALAG